MYKTLLNDIQKKLSLLTASERREILIKQMRKNEEDGFDCLNCSGRCCTFQANSMRMTNLEALEAVVFLEENNLINEETMTRLESCISDYRLDSSIQIGRGEFFRKTYTCPFFNYPSWGCGLGAQNKPYGCIAFNPRRKKQLDGGDCNADLSIQEKRNDIFETIEQSASDLISNELGVSIDKEAIPVKILEILRGSR